LHESITAMAELIEIPITYKGQEILMQAELLNRGYIHGFQIMINEIRVLFEPDEERNYRVIVDETKYSSNKVDLEMIKIIVETLENLK
jgi:hypothetical protein